MTLAIATTFLLGGLAFWWGIRLGRVFLRRGATAHDLFRGNTPAALAFLGLYFLVLVLALYVPQWHWLPLEWRVYGMHVTWTVMRVVLLGVCGVAFVITWHTARLQVVAVVLLGLLGMGGFTAAEAHFLAPIYPSLRDNLRPNGVYQQTSASSCAPAAMATVLRLWTIDAPESKVAKLAGTSLLGTSMPQLIVAARALGMDAVEFTGATWEQMQQVNRPAVLATWLFGSGGRTPHAIALLSLSQDTATVADPAWGRIYEVPRQQFERIWRQEYVPLFRPDEVLLPPTKVTQYLQKLGYLPVSQQPPDRPQITAAIRHLQRANNLEITGQLDKKTALFLVGPFLTQVPTLNSRREP